MKPSYKSGEGVSAYALLLVCAYLAYALITGQEVDIHELMQQAKTVSDIAAAYQLSLPDKGATLGNLIAILTFAYKVYAKFTDSRTELKKNGTNSVSS